MKFKEVKELGKYFSKYLTYDGINLWELSEAAMYNVFLKNFKRRNFLNRKKGIFLRWSIKIKNFIEEIGGRRGSGKNSKILVIVNGISQINTIKPIYEKIGDMKWIRYDSPYDNTTKKKFEMEKIPYSNIDDYIDFEIKKKVKVAEKWLKNKWKDIRKDKDLKKTLGKKYIYIFYALEYFCSTRRVYLEYIRLIELYKKMFDFEKPKLLIVSDDVNVYGQSAALIAKERGIKSICLQHGQFQGNPVGRITCDKMIVNGKADKKYLISKGGNKNKIVVTGQVRFDDMIDKMKLKREYFCKKYGLDLRKKIIVYSYQAPLPGETIIETARDCFFKEIAKMKDKQDKEFVITTRLDTPVPESFKKSKMKLLHGANIQELAMCSEILITAFSTAAIEFVLMNKPVIAINLGSTLKEYINYTEEGVGFKITKAKDFLPALETCLNNKKFKIKFKKAREKFISDYNYKMDGRALERIINNINKVII